jgi:hypothetical protein
MKVFLSWSGRVSHEVALAFKEWLPLVIQSIDPYVSSEDIQKGARWSAEVEKALAESRFSIICLTEDNLTAPWLNFEAGALSKAIANAQVNVCPFLFNIRQSAVEGPLSQFQSVRNERDEIVKLLSTVNAAAKGDKEDVTPKILEKSFEAFWPHLEKQLATIATQHAAAPTPRRSAEDVLEDILEIVRSQQRLAATREDVARMTDLVRDQLSMLEGRRDSLLTNYIKGVLVPSSFLGVSVDSSVPGSAVPGIPIDDGSYSQFLGTVFDQSHTKNPVIPPPPPKATPDGPSPGKTTSTSGDSEREKK